jgi:DNA mismatch repair protein MutS2
MSVFETLEFDKLLKETAGFAKSDKGKERVLSLKPSTYLPSVEKKLLFTDSLVKLFKETNLPLDSFPDLEPTLNRLRVEGALLSEEELLKLLKVLTLSGRLYRFFSSLPEERFPLLVQFGKRLETPLELKRRLEEVIDEYGVIQDSASPRLRSIRRAIRSLTAKIREKLTNLVNRNEDLCPDRIVTERDGRYLILVKPHFKKRFQAVVHDRSSSGQTLYVEPLTVVEDNNRLRELRSQEQEEIRAILKELSREVRAHYQQIKTLFNALVELDCNYAVAFVSFKLGGTLPRFGSYFDAKEAKHPLLLLSGKEVIPSHLKLNKGLVITGPNTGGKTVSLKTFGLLSIMAQTGFLVPAQEGCVLPFFKKWFADVGDEQSIEQSLSTFSAHAKKIAEILREADENSLVLLDELGAGTDPVEGSTLAVGILTYLKKLGAKTVATTHFTPVKLFAYKDDYYQVATVLFDEVNLKPLYRLAYGIIGKSYALVIAQRYGMPREVLEVARSLMKTEDKMAEEIIEALEAEYRRLEKERVELEKLKLELNRQKESLKKREEELQKEFKERLEAYIKELQEQTEKALKERSVEKARQTVKKVVVSVRNRAQVEPEVKPDREPKVGDLVKLSPSGRKGKVVSVDPSKKRAKVQLGPVTVEVKLSQLTVVEEPQAAPKSERVVINAPKPARFFPELKLLGMRGEEALRALEKFLDEAKLVGVSRVRVIHGHGEGILKRLVREYLKESPYVKSFRPGKPEEGGDGATVVELN